LRSCLKVVYFWLILVHTNHWLLNLVRPLARWLRCKDSLIKYFFFCSAITSLTDRMFKSRCVISLRTYHGAPVIVLRIFDWARWTMSILLLLAFPHYWEPYIHIGLSTQLYSRTLYSRLRGDRALISQCRLLAFSFRCVLLASMCRRHVSLLSGCTPRYDTSFAWGSRVLFNVSCGQLCLFKANETCLHFCSFTFILPIW